MSYKLPAAVALAVTAVTVGTQASDDVYQMDEVIVTASRTAQTVDQALAPVTVISREDIERSQATDVTELLRATPGIQVVRNGGPGSITSLFMRGASSSQTLILIDGQRLNSATAGTPELQYLRPEQIERIEVVRGPRSSLYGADAVGGVLQIFTRKGEGEPKFTVRAGAGSHNSRTLGLNFGGKSGNTRFNLGADLYESAGFDVTNDDYAANHGVNLDDDAYRNKSLAGSVSHHLDSGTEVGGSFSYLEGKKEFDGYTCAEDDYFCDTKYPYQPYTEFKTSTLNAYSFLPVTDIWTTRVDVGYTKQESRQLGKGDSPEAPYKESFYETERLSMLLQNDVAWLENQLLTVGVDYYNDRVDNSSAYEDPETGKKIDSRYNAAVFVQNQSQFTGSDLQVALRRDKNETYGYHTTGNVAWGFDLPKAMRLIASYGTAFRAPTFNDLYYPDSGNPEVKPEQSRNYELELRGTYDFGQWSVALFQNDIDDLIAWAPTASGLWKPSNVDEARIQGLEATLKTELKGWSVLTSVTLLDPEDRNREKVLQRRARQYMTIDADRDFGKLSVGGTFRAQGHSYEDVANEDRLDGFATLDLRMSLPVSKELRAELKLTNLFDKEYQTAKGYRNEPRGGFVTMIWTPEL